MLSCKACLTRALQPLSGKASFSEISSTLPVLQHGPPGSQRRFAHRKTTPTTAAGRAFLKEGQEIEKDTHGGSEEFAEKRRKQKLDWAVSKHLEHLENPFNIAKHVEATLEKGRFDEALLLVQRASGNDTDLVVSWNHLIKYQIMELKRVNYAITLFNDMKKRGQSPNEQTFTIIFTGCAKSREPKAASAKALALYKTMLKEDAKIKPNSIHVNAVIQCCGRAGDVENMFTLADSTDAKSGRKNTAYTYTAIINTLRAEAENQDNRKGQSLQQHIDMVEQTITRCKHIWEEVMRNWRNGKLDIDEDLVCAMGRILLLGGNKDRGKIMTMLEETMSVRNYNRTPTGDYAHRINDEMKGISTTGSTKRKATVLSPKIKYAVPRSNTLSLVLAIVREQKQTKLGVKYWNLFVHYYGVNPDTDNYHQMIRLYERSGSSKDAAKAVQQMPSDKPVPPIVYRRALSACINNNMSQNAFADATSILNTMLAHGSVQKTPVDVRALLIYMKGAIMCHFNFRQMDKAGDTQGAKRGYGKQLAAAVEILWTPFSAAKEALIKSQGKHVARKRAEAVEDLADLARKMISAVDKVVNERALAPDDEALISLKEKRSKLNRFAVEFTDPNQRIEDATPAKKDVQQMLDL
ncbi:pentatricopeptide repeat domain-containing protein [Colletotrichum godetiae]|uniref:Pentatricopeptide repeat domain-containing protein n=1 Tax=Colletotrichum godetiae TaxID=1209918 RepID=A0AAJ0AEC0_9PEZI|nr:pentatricopeptide repeat domain-containing protein [Colletotrichum godetiae]KAK1659410.1 pentatricopeptide repeat domain-containing protein [Colletotrichum godetiae]